DASGLRRRAHRGDRHAGPPPLGGDGPGVLEGVVRARRAPLAGRGRRARGAGVRREDGGRARRGPAPGLAGRGPPAAHVQPVGGAGRPALETWTAILAFAPLVGWLGNPAWWRETLPRLAHYYMLSTARKEALPDIFIYYLGRTYEYSLPWHNAWVLMAVTVPASLLAAALLGVVFALRNAGRDRLPLYFLLHLVTLPVLRMLPTPAHDGVRLLLPTFFFLAAMA